MSALPSFELRAGIVFPDWTAVTSPASADALSAILSAFDLAKNRSSYDDEEDSVRQAALEGLAELDSAPNTAWIAVRTDLTRIVCRHSWAGWRSAMAAAVPSQALIR